MACCDDCEYNCFSSAGGERESLEQQCYKEMVRRSGHCDGVRGHGCGVGHWAGFCIGAGAEVMAFLRRWLAPRGGEGGVAALQGRDHKGRYTFYLLLFNASSSCFFLYVQHLSIP